MKQIPKIISAITGFFCLLFSSVVSGQNDTISKLTLNADFYSNYVWRGTRFGTGPAIQPSMKYNGKVLIAGAWGSFDFAGYQETDLFVVVNLPKGFSVGLTDYYFFGNKYFDFSEKSGSHAIETTAGFNNGKFNLSLNCIPNKAGGAGSMGWDKYIQAGYTFKTFNIFLGAGDGWHTFDPGSGKAKFTVCNAGLGTTKTIKVSDSFTIPVVGQLVFNPDKQQMFIVIGFTL